MRAPTLCLFSLIRLSLVVLTACGSAVPRVQSPAAQRSPTESQRERTEDPYTFVGAVLLREPTSVEPGDVMRAFELYRRNGQSMTVAPSDPSIGHEFSLSGCGEAFVTLMDVPHPDYAGERVRASIASIFSETPELPHSAFHQVMLVPGHNPAAKSTCQSLLLTFLAALAQSTDAVGVFMENAIHEANGFKKVAVETDGSMRPLLHLGFSLARENQTHRISVLSWGMPSSFGLPDVFATQPERDSAVDALELAFLVSAQMIARGVSYTKGDTVGRDTRERLPVRLTQSPVDPTAKVVRLDLP